MGHGGMGDTMTRSNSDITGRLTAASFSKDEVEGEQLPDGWTWTDDFIPDIITAVKLGIPIMISSSARLVQALVISIMLGRKDTVLLAAVSTSTIWTEIVDEASRGGTSQVGVLCSQALGSRKYTLVGVWMQMGMIMVSVLYPIFALSKAATGSILSFMGVPAVLTEPAGSYAVWVAPALFFDMMYGVLGSYYYAQGVVHPDMVLQILFIPLTSWFIWIGIDSYDLGIYGVAGALSVKRVIRFFVYLTWTWAAGYHKKTWKGVDFNELFVKERWMTMISLCIPAAFGAIMEIINFSLNSVLAARLGPTGSAAFDLVISMNMLLFTLIWGTCQGFALIMARRLGENRPQAAQGMVKAGAGVVYFMVLVVAALMYFFMHDFAMLGSNDPAVRELVVSIKGLAASGCLSSGFMFLITEVLAKQGRISIVFTYVTITNWFIGLPISFFCAPIYGIWGIFVGLNVSYTLSFVCCSYYVYHSDWQEIAKQARKNAEVSEEKVHDDIAAEKLGQM